MTATTTATMTIIEQKTEFYILLSSLSSTLRIAQSALGSTKSLLLNALCRKLSRIEKLPPSLLSSPNIFSTVLDDVKSQVDKDGEGKEKKRIDLGDLGELVSRTCKITMSNYEKIVALTRSSLSSLPTSWFVDEAFIDKNMVQICDTMMDFPTKFTKSGVAKSTLKPIVLLDLSVAERFIKSSGVKSFDQKEYDRLMKKHADLLGELNLTTDYARLFAPSFSLVQLSPYLPSTLPKALIDTIIIPYTQLTCADTVDIIQLLIK